MKKIRYKVPGLGFCTGYLVEIKGREYVICDDPKTKNKLTIPEHWVYEIISEGDKTNE